MTPRLLVMVPDTDDSIVLAAGVTPAARGASDT